MVNGLGEFSQAVLGLTFGFGCALLLAFVCLKLLLGLMNRQSPQVPDTDSGPSHAGPYLLPAPASSNSFARSTLSESALGTTAPGQHGYSGDAA